MTGPTLRHFLLLGLALLWLTPAGSRTALAQQSLLDTWLHMQPSEHAGLLGKRYVSGSYTYLSHGEEFLDEIDSALEGYSISLNHPIWLPDDETWLGVDLFSTWSTIGLGGATHLPPGGIGLQFDSDTTSHVYGATVYAAPCQPIRPLAQVGAVFSRNRSLILVDGFGGTFVDRDTSLLLRAGMEADIASWLSLRTVLDIDSEDALDDSAFLGDLIAWPTDRVFFRTGVIVPFDGNALGGHVGVGVTF